MSFDKYELEKTYERHAEFHGRDQKGVVKDKIYRGIFERTLEVIHGYKKAELRKAVSQGWIKATYVDPDGSGLRKAYLWVEEEMPQRNWFKQQIDKAYRWIRGEYDRYYGRDE